jgi:hypothetical protein
LLAESPDVVDNGWTLVEMIGIREGWEMEFVR